MSNHKENTTDRELLKEEAYLKGSVIVTLGYFALLGLIFRTMIKKS